MTGAERIRRMIETTHGRLKWLAYVSAFGGFALVLGVWFILSLVGLIDLLTPKLRAASTLSILLLSAFLFVHGLKKYKKPNREEAINKVDSLSEMRPASSLVDVPVRPHSKAASLWAAHKQRIDEEASTLKSPSLFSKARSIDPLFLRFLTPLALIAAAIFANDAAIPRIQSSFRADFGTLVGADDLTAQAWVTPPAYTGQAPFDVPTNETFSAPAGSEFTIRVDTHGKPKLKLHYSDETKMLPLTRGEDGTYETKLILDLDEVVAEIDWWGTRASYEIKSSVDQFPSIKFTKYPTVDENDRTAFEWEAEDDYGITQVELFLRLSKPKNGEENLSDKIVLDLPGIEPLTASNSVALNLTRHKWAGLPVIAHLRAIDAAGQITQSREAVFNLPEKLFLQPMAKAAMEVRNVVLRDWNEYAPLPDNFDQIMDESGIVDVTPSRLEQAPADIKRAAIMLEALTHEPDSYFNDPIIYLGLRQAKHVLSTADSKPNADKSEGILWSVAMRAEYGSLADAARALEAAKKALEAALRDGASEEEIRRLMNAYRQAVQNYVDMRMAEAIRRGVSPETLDGESGGGTQLGGSDLEEMLDKLASLAETGARDQARQLLSDMSDLLDRMKNLQLSQGGEGSDPLGNPQSDAMSKALEELAEELRDQRDLTDDTRQEMRDQQNSQSGQPQGGQSSQQGNQSSDLADRQQELAERELKRPGGGSQNGVEETPSMPPGAGSMDQNGEYEMDAEGFAKTPQGDALEEAKRAQERAAEALSKGDLEGAARHQRDAEQALARAATELAARADKMREAEGTNQASQQQADNSDPLGRPSGSGVAGDGNEVKVPELLDRQRAHEILEELRRRSAESGLTNEEMEYLLRLLKRF